MKKLIKKMFAHKGIRFLFVGGLNTIVGYGSYALLLLIGFNYLLSNTLSYIIGVIHSYLWNKNFTFKTKTKNISEIIRFVLVYISSYLFGLFTLFILVHYLKLNPYLAGLVNLIFTTLISWFGHNKFSFRSDDNEKN